MVYTPEQAAHLVREHLASLDGLVELQKECTLQGLSIANPMVQEHMLHGVSRRIMVLKRSVENIFDLFPPSTTKPLPTDTLSDVQINLHAFVMNLYGVFENWAWAYYHRHDLQGEIRDRRQVGMFSTTMSPYLPRVIREYLSSEVMAAWQRDYLKNYRDALAHRIPLYIPPANFTSEESERYSLLEVEKLSSLRARDLIRFEGICLEEESIGVASPMFMHSFSEGGEVKAILLHPQVLSDSNTVVEFGTKFLAHWHERA
jgi:hypothetical protein